MKISSDYSLLTQVEIIFLLVLRLIRFKIIFPLKGFLSFGFVGRGSKFYHKRKFSFGNFLNIGDYVIINSNSSFGVRVGNRFTLRDYSKIDCQSVYSATTSGIEIGNNVGISENALIQVRGKIEIGNNVIIGPSFTLISENHKFDNPAEAIRLQGVTRNGVSIKDNVWIGSNVTILDGVTVGENSVIAAGAVVNKSFPNNVIIGGIPARILKRI